MHFFYLSAEGLPKAVKARFSGRSRSSFYYEHKMPARNKLLHNIILPIHQENPYYGPKQIANHLKQYCSIEMNHKCVYRIMRLYGLRARTSRKKRSKNQYTSGKPSLPNHIKNLVIQNPNHVWEGDFTKIYFKRRPYYFATVLDACTREVIGWHIATDHSTNLVIEALEMALRTRKAAPKVFHSDHGSEYISETYVAKLKAHDITPSNAGKGKPWQNGRQESFFGRFKEELGDLKLLTGVDRLWEKIGHHIHHYNTRRIHSRLRMSPRDFFLKKMAASEPQKDAA
jgi:putative transposase